MSSYASKLEWVHELQDARRQYESVLKKIRDEGPDELSVEIDSYMADEEQAYCLHILPAGREIEREADREAWREMSKARL